MSYVSYIDYTALVAKHGKRCSMCGKKKSPKEFWNSKVRHDGKQVYCAECCRTDPTLRARQKAYASSERGLALRREYNRKYREQVNADPVRRARLQENKRIATLRRKERNRMRAAGVDDEEMIEACARENALQLFQAEKARKYGDS